MLQQFINGNQEFEVTEEAKKNIKQIQKICNKQYSNQSHCGNAALNRAILLDEKIASLLTPDTIAAIIYIHAVNYRDLQKEIKIKEKSILVKRNSGNPVSLAAVLYYGFSDGVQAIKCISNNQKNISNKENFVRNYFLQAEKFETYTQKIINNIKTAAKTLHIFPEPEDNLNQQNNIQPIRKLYNQVKATIELIHYHNFSSSFFLSPGLGLTTYSKKPMKVF